MLGLKSKRSYEYAVNKWDAEDYISVRDDVSRTQMQKPAAKEKKVAAKAKTAAARLNKVSRQSAVCEVYVCEVCVCEVNGKEVIDADCYVAIGDLTDSLIAD